MSRPSKRAPQGRRRYPSRRKVQGKPSRRQEFSPDADPRLKSVFSGIGVPKSKPFTPDWFQTEAVAAMAESDCLVTAPTGAGKTWIA
ncbi:MAG TPA: ATP-dependent DNA helicase, partial [Desulfosarcina sp.]|nr:ATP-dependent DNA helicase [Desulfosarcina sp.]